MNEKDNVLLNSFRDFVTARRRMLGVLLIMMLLLAACGSGPGDSWAGIARHPDSDTVYVSFNKRVLALNPANGEIEWEYGDEAKFYAVPVVDNGTIFVGDYQGKLHAIDAETGQPQWVYEPERRKLIGPLSPDPTDRVIAPVALSDETVFFGLGSRNVVAVSRESAEDIWTFETDHGVWGKPLYLPGEGGAPDTLYVVSLDQHLYAIDTATGDELWKLDLGGAVPGNMTYDAERNWVYVGTFVSEVLAVDLTAQIIVDRFATHDWVWGSPAFFEDTLYVGDLSGTLFAIAVTDDGFAPDVVWERPIAEDSIRSTPLILEDEGLLVVGSEDKHFYTVNLENGATVLTQKTEGQALTELIAITPDVEMADKLVVVGTSDDTHVVAYNYETGEDAWKYSD